MQGMADFASDVAKKFILHYKTFLDSSYWPWMAALPTLTVIFFFYKYFRPYFSVTVNCWFCKTNQHVPYSQRNSFVCHSCEQYNGFTADGGYNKVIKEQHCQFDQPTPSDRLFSVQPKGSITNSGTLCHICNLKQQKKLQRLSSFRPTSEKNFDWEWKAFSKRLELDYGLCNQCTEKTSHLLQEQDTHIRNMYHSSPINAGPKKIHSTVTSTVPPKGPLRVKGQNSSFPHCGSKGQTDVRHYLSTLLSLFRVVVKLGNLLLASVAFLYMGSECLSMKSSLIGWLILYPRVEKLLGIVFDVIVFINIAGNVTQYFATLSHRKCWWHISGLFLWILTALSSYNLSILCRGRGAEVVKVLLTLISGVNVFVSLVCFLKEFVCQNVLRNKNVPKPPSLANGNIGIISNTEHHEKDVMQLEESGELFSAMKLSSRKSNAVGSHEGSFLFFDHKLSTDEFEKSLKSSPGTPQPLISPPKFTLTYEPSVGQYLISRKGIKNWD